jgi:hypothetical protein
MDASNQHTQVTISPEEDARLPILEARIEREWKQWRRPLQKLEERRGPARAGPSDSNLVHRDSEPVSKQGSESRPRRGSDSGDHHSTLQIGTIRQIIRLVFTIFRSLHFSLMKIASMGSWALKIATPLFLFSD